MKILLALAPEELASTILFLVRFSLFLDELRSTKGCSMAGYFLAGTSGFGLKIEHYPCWRVVAGVYLPTHPSVYPTVHEPVPHLRRE